MEEESRDGLHLAIVELFSAWERPLRDVNYADDYRGKAGPLHALTRTVDLATMLADPPQPACTRIALGNGLRGDKSEGSGFPYQAERAPEEVGSEIRGTAGPFVKCQ
jgi:hypothetical protein